MSLKNEPVAEVRQDELFCVDHMLIKLGKYLRILGFDASWEPALRTHELIRRANAQHRVFLTRNRRLRDQYPCPDRSILIQSADPVAQLSEVVSGAGLDAGRSLFTRCIRCNVELSAIADKREIEDRVHPNVYACYEKFYRCPACRTVFWKGSHVRNTCRKLSLPLPDCGRA